MSESALALINALNPLQAMGFGIATGVFLGFLIAKSTKPAKKAKKEAPAPEHKLLKFYQLPASSSMKKYMVEYGMFEQAGEMKKVELRTQAEPDSRMMADPICTQLMALIAHVAQSKRHLEVGVYTGYNLLQQMLELKEISKANGDAEFLGYAMDNTVGYLFLTRHHFAEAGIMSGNVDLMIQPAVESFEEMLTGKNKFGETLDRGVMIGKLDTIFIDADKPNYSKYIDASIELLRPGGILFVDNVLWSGKVWEYKYEGKHTNDEKTIALHEVNQKIKSDPRIKHCILPFGDGLSVCVKL